MAELRVSRKASAPAAAACVVEYGSAYSRTGGGIQNPQTVSEACTAGQEVDLTFNAPAGTAVYYRQS
jgi:hypothetical protein